MANMTKEPAFGGEDIFHQSKPSACYKAVYNIDWVIKHYDEFVAAAEECWTDRADKDRLMERLALIEKSLLKLQEFVKATT